MARGRAGREARDRWDVDADAARLYAARRLALVRMGYLLLADRPAAEAAVQAGFADLRRHGRHAQDADEALLLLRSRVVVHARRHRPAATPAGRPSGVPDPLSGLGRREREALVLLLWSDLAEGQAAEVLGLPARRVVATAERGLEGLHHRGDQTAAWAAPEERLRLQLRARAEQVGGHDLTPAGLPDPAPRSWRPLVFTALGVVAVVAAAAALSGGQVARDGDIPRPPGSELIDVDGDGAEDVVTLGFDPAAHTYQVRVALASGSQLVEQGLAVDPPEIVGGVDLDADYAEEVAVRIGSNGNRLPEFFRADGDDLVRLRVPLPGEVVNGYDPESALNRFEVQRGRLYTWRPDVSGDPRAERPRALLWQWRVVDGVRLVPRPPTERCLRPGESFPRDCRAGD